MLLAFDVGNTNIHMGVWQNGSWRLSWRARTVTEKMPDEYAVLVRNFLESADVGHKAITSVILSSVVPTLTSAFIELSQRYFDIEPLVITHQTDMGVEIAIDQPEQAGADRMVNAAAVVALYRGPGIVVDFGTSTNFDVVSADNKYIGGALAPGIGVAHDALVSRAAKLHKVDLIPPPSPIGSNTIHAMQSGIFWGYVGLVEGILTRLKATLNHEDTKVIATGGLAPLFNDHTDMLDILAPELTLDGLRVIHERNEKQALNQKRPT